MKAALMTRETLARHAAERWERQYPHECVGRYGDKYQVWLNIKALGRNPKPEAIDETIGNQSWTRLDPCDNCGKQKDELVSVGQAPDYESSTATICEECLRKALAVFKTKP